MLFFSCTFEGTSDRGFLLDTLPCWSYNYCFPAKWKWHFLAFPFHCKSFMTFTSVLMLALQLFYMMPFPCSYNVIVLTGWTSTTWVVRYSSLSCSTTFISYFTVYISPDYAIISGSSTLLSCEIVFLFVFLSFNFLRCYLVFVGC